MKTTVLLKVVLFTLIILTGNLDALAQSWNEIIKATPSDRAERDYFGGAVDISGNHAIIGAFYEDEDSAGKNTLHNAGSSYIYELNSSGEWQEVQKLVASDRESSDWFGVSVSISGDRAIVGAYGEDEDAAGENDMALAGSAYVFERNSNGVWVEVQKLVASNRENQAWFGGSVSISGDYAVVGASLEGDTSEGMAWLDAGAAYIFERDVAGVWKEVQKIVASDRAQGDQFGLSVSVSSNYLIVGAYGENEDSVGENTMSNSGAAYIFERDASRVWNEVQKIVASDRAPGDNFGADVSISGENIIIGSSGNDKDLVGGDSIMDAGAAYIFERNSNGVWNEVQKIVASGRVRENHFGKSVSISENHAIVGAFPSFNSYPKAGTAYMFKQNSDGEWNEINKTVKPYSSDNAYLLRVSVSLSGDRAILGTNGEDTDSTGGNTLTDAGSAFILEFGCFLDNSVTTNGVTMHANQMDAAYQWLDCNDGNSAIIGATDRTYNATVNGDYAVEITIDKCVDTSDCVKVESLGIHENRFGKSFNIYPNPTYGVINIDLGMQCETANVTITDVMGKVLQVQSFKTVQHLELYLNEPPGVYFIEVLSGKQKVVSRVIRG